MRWHNAPQRVVGTNKGGNRSEIPGAIPGIMIAPHECSLLLSLISTGIDSSWVIHKTSYFSVLATFMSSPPGTLDQQFHVMSHCQPKLNIHIKTKQVCPFKPLSFPNFFIPVHSEPPFIFSHLDLSVWLSWILLFPLVLLSSYTSMWQVSYPCLSNSISFTKCRIWLLLLMLWA